MLKQVHAMTHKIREGRSRCSICGFEAAVPNRLRAHIIDAHNEFQVKFAAAKKTYPRGQIACKSVAQLVKLYLFRATSK